MGLVASLLNVVFGNDRNVLKDTVEVFRANAEEEAERSQQLRIEALKQFAREYESKNDTPFNRFMDGVNRLPRPALALGTLGLFLAAMIDPIWFSARMQGIALVPEPLWWLLGVVVSFYFGARHQIKSQQFQKSVALSVARAPDVAENLKALRGLRGVHLDGGFDDISNGATQPDQNAALDDWRRNAGGPATM